MTCTTHPTEKASMLAITLYHTADRKSSIFRGGQDHQAASVQRFPWDETAEDAWGHDEI
jgi:hypothetical protein